jgi:hypothetical protein
MQQCFFRKTLRRLGIGAAHLYHHHVKILVHINAKSAHWTALSFGGLDVGFCAFKLAAGFLEWGQL